MAFNNTKKNVSIFEDSSFSALGGGQVVTLSVARFFKEAGYHVTVCDHKVGGIFHDKVAQHMDRHVHLYVRLKRRSSGQHASNRPPLIQNSLYFILFLINVTLFVLKNRKDKTDIYYSATRHSHIFVFCINIFRKRRWIAHVHSNEKRPFLKKVMRFIFMKADKVLFVSNYLKDFYKLPTGYVIYNPVDEIGQKKKSWQKETQLSVGFVGNLLEWKGINYFLAACADLNQNKTDIFSFNVFGGGNNIGELREKFPFVNFSGVTPRREIYQNIDVLVLPSIDAESCPMAILEALKFDIVCITTNFGGQQELVDYFGGITIKPFSHLEITNAILHAKENYTDIKKSLKKTHEIFGFKEYATKLGILLDEY